MTHLVKTKSAIPAKKLKLQGTLAGVFYKCGGTQGAIDVAMLAYDDDPQLAKIVDLYEELPLAQKKEVALEDLCRIAGIPAHEFVGRLASIAYKMGRNLADLMVNMNITTLTDKALESALSDESSGFKDREALLRRTGIFPEKTSLVSVQQNNQQIQVSGGASNLPAFETQADNMDRALKQIEGIQSRESQPEDAVDGEIVD